MQIRLWGVRGSIACPGPTTVRYGGNTSCIELRIKDRVIIIDSGTGIRLLGQEIVQTQLSKGQPISAEIFLTHTHLDHITGFPFFQPLYIPQTSITVYGPMSFEEDPLEKIISDQLRYRYFPVSHSDLAANITYVQLNECELDLGDHLKLKTKFLNHPLLCLGYRFEYQNKVFCTVFDTEPYRNIFPRHPNQLGYDPQTAKEGDHVALKQNTDLLQFIQGADLLIHDAQYTLSEYIHNKKGWGHSPMDYAIHNAVSANVKKLILFHHDPMRTDDELDAYERFYQACVEQAYPEIYFAKEGMIFDL
ncbi:MAG: MBL fold metallo-hydrolase [Desulfobacterales bacterium]|nr:MBL fold metallo-hydrolase [Desulfobacterales bacterium]